MTVISTMEETKYLFLVKSKGFRAYVVAENTDKAWEKFHTWLEEKDYGYYWERNFQSVELVASAGGGSPKSAEGVAIDDRGKADMIFL